MEDDPRMGSIREELILEWQKTNGNQWIINSKGEPELRQDFQDWMHGSSKQRSNNRQLQTLAERTEEKFRERFQEDAKRYDQMEKVRIYDNPFQDPAISKAQNEAIRRTNADPDVSSALRQGKGRFNEPYSEVWIKIHTRELLKLYRDFVREYPEKSQAYAGHIPLLESQADALQSLETNKQKDSRTYTDSKQAGSLDNEGTKAITEGDILSIDPRDYFKSTAFQKDAEKIDSNKSHPWQAARGDGLLISDELGKVALAETFDEEETDTNKKVGLLLAEATQDGVSSSIYIRNELSKRVRQQLADVVNEVSPRLSGENRHIFVRTLIKLIPTL